MIETIVTIRRGGAPVTLAFGAAAGMVLGRLGALGLLFVFPMLLLVGAVAWAELSSRHLSTAVLAFAVGCAVSVWLSG